jgi:chromatin structure-remodeling complex protein RSC7
MQYPKIMQPTHARWEHVPSAPQKSQALRITADEASGDSSNGTSIPDPNQDQAHDTIFPEIPTVFTRNFMITDTYYTTPSTSILGYPGPDEDVVDVGPGGLTHVADDAVAALPEDCRKAFIEARAEEKRWKSCWGSERGDGNRSTIRITYNV